MSKRREQMTEEELNHAKQTYPLLETVLKDESEAIRMAYVCLEELKIATDKLPRCKKIARDAAELDSPEDKKNREQVIKGYETALKGSLDLLRRLRLTEEKTG